MVYLVSQVCRPLSALSGLKEELIPIYPRTCERG